MRHGRRAREKAWGPIRAGGVGAGRFAERPAGAGSVDASLFFKIRNHVRPYLSFSLSNLALCTPTTATGEPANCASSWARSWGSRSH